MEAKTVEDLMVPLDEYPVVTEDATLLEAILTLDDALQKLPEGRSPYRAVLVVDETRRVVGKIGQLGFLKALEPKYRRLGKDFDKLAAAGVSPTFISSMMEQYSFFDDSLQTLCRQQRDVQVKDAMIPITQSIDVATSLGQAIHNIVIWQQLSLLVTKQNEAVGLLRLSDLFDEVARQMKSAR
jgi:CBS-domain-containing membrane protein